MSVMLWFLAGFAGFCVVMGVIGNRRRRGGPGHLDSHGDATALRGQADVHLRQMGQSGGGGGYGGPGMP